MLLNKRQLEKLKEDWWKNDEFKKKCVKPEDQSDGISIQNIGGVFIVIFVGIGMACVTLVFEYWYYKYRKNPSMKIIDVAEADTKHDHRIGGQMMGKQSLGLAPGAGGGSELQMPGGADPQNPTKPTKGSYFNANMLRSRLSQPFNFKPKFQI